MRPTSASSKKPGTQSTAGARARVEHALSRLKNRKILRDCRLKGNDVHQAVLEIARLHDLALTR